MPTLPRRADGLSAGYTVPAVPWLLDPAHEAPGRLCPMSVMPPPEHTLIHRIGVALGQLGASIAAGAVLMMLASYLATPG